MGDIADMMLEGDLCQVCGVYMEDGAGFPQACEGCKSDESHMRSPSTVRLPAAIKVVCPECGKRVKAVGLAQHTADVHGAIA